LGNSTYVNQAFKAKDDNKDMVERGAAERNKWKLARIFGVFLDAKSIVTESQAAFTRLGRGGELGPLGKINICPAEGGKTDEKGRDRARENQPPPKRGRNGE